MSIESIPTESGSGTATSGTPRSGALAELVDLLADDPTLGRAAIRPDARIGVAESARPLALAALAATSDRRPIVIACPTSTMAAQLADDLRHFVPGGADAVALFPAWETLPFERISPSIDTMGRRHELLWRLSNPEDTPRIIVAGARALLQRLTPTVAEPIMIGRGEQIDADDLVAQLVAAGYRREPIVEHRGEFARRGAIIDVFGSTGDLPIRIDLWGDEVDRLTTFSVADQRSVTDLDTVRIFAARELLPDDAVRARASQLVASEPWGREFFERLAEGTFFDGMESFLPWLLTESDTEASADAMNGGELLTDRLGPDAKVIILEPRRLRDRAADLLAEEDDLARTLASTWTRDPTRSFPKLHADPDRLLQRPAGVGEHFTDHGVWTIDTVTDSPETPMFNTMAWGPVVGDGPIDMIRDLLAGGYRVVVAADGAGSANRLRQLLAEHDLEFSEPAAATTTTARRSNPTADLTRPGGHLAVAPLSRGCIVPDAKLALLAEADLTGRRRAHRPQRAPRRQTSSTVEDLQPGNYVVHYHHGVGKYEGMVTRTIGGVERDYLLVAYKGGDKLYIPSDQIDALRQYTGGETPTLHRLGGSDFAATKGRVRSAIREIAQELVVLYQTRINAPGFAFGADTPWQAEMEAAFGFVETPDQQRAIDEVKLDMEREYPMDRLICGDVGFGKTEVAIRAAFKAIQDGKQVAVLAPTTLLANQHGNTFADRFAGYPIRVEVLSRFLTNKQAREVIDGLASGDVDCVIGTHRLLSDGIAFKDLGLLVIDEEQRFGVHHKEAIKHLRSDVDVLTLSATPIPRTLEMSLVGIRDLSLLQTPPADRQPILTYVGEYDERVAVEAIRRELLREGQVFWVHNRVQSIEHAAARLRELVPEASIAVAHGQMDEGSLEQVVLDFWEGRHDVLVCTTIIESGIDMPTVNTLVVERADLLGLGQMHQLRGRVGRSGSRAYAYLFHPVDMSLSEEAYERLRTIGESTELGSGFKIAMRDLEIRGAGNLLGAAQSGHIAAVGYDLYCQMVTEAVAELKGEPVAERRELKLDLPSDAHLPEDYVPSEALRLEAYRRLATIESPEDHRDLEREWIDRYGPPPAPAAALLRIGALRAECHRLGIDEIHITEREIRIAPLTLTASQSLRLQRLLRPRGSRSAGRGGEARIKEVTGDDGNTITQVIMPLPEPAAGPGRRQAPDPVEYLLDLLAQLVPHGDGDPAPSGDGDDAPPERGSAR